MIGNPSAMADSPVGVLAVARIHDKVVLAQVFGDNTTNDEKKSFPKAMDTMLARLPKTTPYWKDMTSVGDGNLYAFVDAENTCIIFAGIRDKQYPERVVAKLLRETSDKVRNSETKQSIEGAREGSLSKAFNKPFRELIKNFGDATQHDKVSEANHQVLQVQGIMQENVKRILDTHNALEGLQESSSNMQTEANRFLKQSKDLKRQMELRNIKIKIMFGLCIGAVLAYFILPFIEF